MKNVYLVDVSSMYFRAFYAIRNLNNSKGLPTNALYGFISMAIKLLKDKKPDYMAFCFDNKTPSFRVDIDPNYKANRTEMPEDLQKQVPYIRPISEALGISCYNVEGFEADDIIGTIACKAADLGMQVTIVSGDKDFGQLVNSQIKMYDPMKDIYLDEVGVYEKMGVQPQQVIDYLAIVGDASDNVPGVRGIGPKGAQKLLGEYQTLENIYTHINAITPVSIQKKLIESKESAFLSKKLVTIVTDMDLNISLSDLKLKPLDRQKLKEFFVEFEFRNFEKNLLGDEPVLSESSGTTVEVESQKKEEVSNQETQDHNVTVEEIVGSVQEIKKSVQANSPTWGIATSRGIYIGQGNKVWALSGNLEDFTDVLNQKKCKWLGYDLKEFFKVLSLPVDQKVEWDSMLAAYVLRAGEVGSFESVYKQYLNKTLPELASISQLYCAHIETKNVLEKLLNEKNGNKVFRQIELPLIPVLYEMEKVGVKVDPDILQSQSKQLKKEIKAIEEEVFENVGERFNLSSPKQLGHILFDKLKMPVIKKTKTGYSTDSDVLDKLSKEYPITKKIIEHRELSKLLSTYIDALPALINKKTKRIHTSFNQAVTSTGRLSSTNPNLQNIPIRTSKGSAIRRAFVTEKGCKLISADYSQIELRILAHITGDKNLTQAFKENLDIHTATASEVFSVPLKEVTSDLRRTAKAVNFGIAYGMGAYGLAENLNISRSEASDIIKRYFARFAGVRDYMHEIVETAKKQGYVETLMGRRRYMDELFSSNARVKQFGERAAINAPIQGTASDLVKLAMISVCDLSEAQLLLQVHDELIFEAKAEVVDQVSKKIKNTMESVYKLNVPLVVQLGVGDNWETAHS